MPLPESAYRGDWADAIIAAIVVGVVVAAGVAVIILFYSSELPWSTRALWAFLPAGVVGLLVAGILLLLYQRRQMTVSDLWEALKNFWHELGKEPF